jgi:peptidoglycan/xylan/chitin deacetylase (PgdA/CDA1 family)
MLISAISALAVLAAGILIWPYFATEILAALARRIVWRATTKEPTIALTFDDGPDPVYTPQVLRILSDKHIKATFFLVGERARRYPKIVAAIRTGGHEVGNHADSWNRTLFKSRKQFEQDLLRAESSLGLADEPHKFFRPAGIWVRTDQVQTAEQHGYSIVLGSAYAFDPMRPPAGFISWEITRALRPGAIIVLHDSGGDRSNTVAALPQIIDAAEARRLRFVTLSRMLSP